MRVAARFIILPVAVFLCCLHSYGQYIDPLSGFGIEANAIAGKVWRHEEKFTLPIPALTTGADINFQWHTYGTKLWQQDRNYPTFGIGFNYLNYGIDSIYGRLFVVYPNLTIPLIRSKHFSWTLRVGDGPAYVTKHYQRTSPIDTVNVAIGSHFNNSVQLLTDAVCHLNKHWDAQAGIGIIHFSNASYAKPNLGINMIGAHLGVSYYPVTSMPPRIGYNLRPLPPRWLVQARISMAGVASYTNGGPVYPVYIASAYSSRRWLGKNKVFAGLDYAYYRGIYAWLRNTEQDVGHENQNAYKTAVFAGNEFLFGRLGLVFQVGYYLRQAAIKTDPVYEKAGAHFYIVQREHGPLKELFLSALVKTHLSVAELGEIGVGCGF